MSLELKVSLYTESLSNSEECLWIARTTAIKDGVVVKSKDVAEMSSLENIKDTIKASFSKAPETKVNIEISDYSQAEAYIQDGFFGEVTQLLKDDLQKSTLFQELKTYHQEVKGGDVPSYINFIPEDAFSKNILLMRICLYFEQNPGDVFEFPLFLQMKPKLDPEWEVEDLIAETLERSAKIFEME